MLNELSLFSGYGGFSLGLRLAGIQTRAVAYVEWEKYPQEIIKARIKDGFLDDAPIFGDISAFRGEQFRGLVQIISAGFPCPPFSVAGLGRGADDKRNLWPETLRVIREVRPSIVILENVPGILAASRKRGTPSYGAVVVGELAEEGYVVRWETLGADDVGAPHRRKRWLCIGVLAESTSDGLHTPEPRVIREDNESPTPRKDAAEAGRRSPPGELADTDCQRGCGRATHWERAEDAGQPPETQGRNGGYPIWPPSPSDADGWAEILMERPDLAPALTKDALATICGVADGATRRVDRLKALGNGIAPAVVAEFLRTIRL